jgi:hypothetical protein
VSFDEAASVFFDSLSTTGNDPGHSLGETFRDIWRVIHWAIASRWHQPRHSGGQEGRRKPNGRHFEAGGFQRCVQKAELNCK